MSLNSDPFVWDPSHVQAVQPVASAQHAVKGSLVSKAIDLLNRPPSVNLDRPPELATLDTPPSSCEPPSVFEDRSLLKPPTVPSQSGRQSPSPVPLLHHPFAIEEGTTPLTSKMEISPLMGGGSFDRTGLLASGSFDAVSAGDSSFEESTIMHFEGQEVAYYSSPVLLSAAQLDSLTAGNLAYMPECQADRGYDGDVNLEDSSFHDYLHRLESPEFVGFESFGGGQIGRPSEEPALFTGSTASESSITTNDDWFRMMDPVSNGAVPMVPGGGSGAGDNMYIPLTFFTPPLTPLPFPSPVLAVRAECSQGQDLSQLCAVPAHIERPASVSSMLNADKVSLYHNVQQSNSFAISAALLPAPVLAPIAPASGPTNVPAEPAVQVAQFAPTKTVERGRRGRMTANKAAAKARVAAKKQARQPRRPATGAGPAVRAREQSCDFSDSCSTVVAGDGHHLSSSVQCDLHQSLQQTQQQHQQHQQSYVAVEASVTAVAAAVTTDAARPKAKAARRRAPRKVAKPAASQPAVRRKRAARPRAKPPGPPIRYPCLFAGCGKTFSSPHNLQEHGQVHNDPREREFKCPLAECLLEKREYFFRRDLRRHNYKSHCDVPGLIEWLDKWADEEAEKRAVEKARKKAEEEGGGVKLAEMVAV